MVREAADLYHVVRLALGQAIDCAKILQVFFHGEVVEEAKKFGSAGFVMYPGDNKPHSVSEFLADKK